MTANLADDLRRLGVAQGDVLMVHASLKAVGPVDGGVPGLVGALEAAVGPTGTLLMVLGAEDPWSWVNDRPEAERPGLLADAEPFDPWSTPADPDVGVLAERFRRMPGTLVSDHPEGRFAARGRLAGHFVADPPWDDYYGPGSALERLVEIGGRVLRLGADPDTVTLTHYAEALVDLPDKRRVRRHRLVAGPDGPVVGVVDTLDDEHGIVDQSGEDYFITIHDEYLATGRARTGLVGQARAELFDAADYTEFAVDWMTSHF